jgi:spore germination protein GerM
MKKLLCIFLLSFFMLTSNGCRGNQEINQNESQAPNNNKAAEQQVKAPDNNKEKVNVLLYFPDKSLNFLVPEERYAELNKSLERTIVDELIKGPYNEENSRVIPSGTSIKSITIREDTIIVNLSKDFKEIAGRGEKPETLAVYSIVNSLTAIPGIKNVVFEINGKREKTFGENVDFDKPLKRNRKLLNRNTAADPGEILKQQIEFEKQGKWLNSYILSSDDENNTMRRYYNDYVKEMQEIQALGFMDQEVSIGKYALDKTGTKAKVNVKFYTKDEAGNNIEGASMDIDCVKIEGAWLVDWTSPQQQ